MPVKAKIVLSERELRFRGIFVLGIAFDDMNGITTKQSIQKQIIKEIETYIREGGGEYEGWYVGITDNPMEPVNDALLLQKIQGERLVYIETSSPQVAWNVADYFVNLCGTDGNIRTNEINRACNSIYVYKKAAHFVFWPKRI